MVETQTVVAEANRILGQLKPKDTSLRLMGACAIRVGMPAFGRLYDSLDRPLSDLDFAAFSKEARKIEPILNGLGYTQDRRIVGFHEAQRNFYYSEAAHLKLDIFFDRLAMCHTIEFKDRLHLTFPTIPPSDILLEKMQIVQIAVKDLKDTVILLRGQQLSEIDDSTINIRYISKLLADDWGFWYTVMSNLDKVKNYGLTLTQLSEADKQDVSQKIDSLKERFNSEPKSFRWKMRARVGPSVKWYNEVEDLIRQ
jgi:hypothetical protein